MKIELEKCNGYIYNAIFKKIKLYVNNYIGIFFSKPIGKNCELKFNLDTNNMILKKFNVRRWDLCEGNYLHLKFLVTYSPILSKFVDPSEFDDIKVIKPSNEKNEFLIKFKYKCRDFYSVDNIHYIEENIMISERNNIFNEV